MTCTGIYGDLNNDGIVNVVDELYLSQYLAGTRTLDTCQLIKADVNDDGVVNATDIMMITNYYMGLTGAKGYTGQPLHAASNGSTPIGTIVCYTDYNLSGTISGWNAPNSSYIVFINDWHNNNYVIPTKLMIGTLLNITLSIT